MAECLVRDHLPLVKHVLAGRADLSQLISARRQIDWKGVAVLIRNTITNQLPDIDPPLIVGGNRLLQSVLLTPLVIEDRERCLRRLFAAVAGGNQGGVIGVDLPLPTLKMPNELVREGSLSAKAES